MPNRRTENPQTPPGSMAAEADPHALYETAVQQPILMVELIEHVFEQTERGEPRVLREDFCGTAHLSTTWVRSGADRAAVGVDLDPAVLDYAERHSREPLGEAADRLELVCGDVLGSRTTADVLASLNFSHFIYKTRTKLREYLRHAHRCLNPGGMLLLDVYGGPGAMRSGEDARPFGDFEYRWQQEPYDPLTGRVVNHIHFRFPDGSALERAFSYDWRLWSLVELRELLAEAGFEETMICFESPEGLTDELDTAEYDAWVAYLIAFV